MNKMAIFFSLLCFCSASSIQAAGLEFTPWFGSSFSTNLKSSTNTSNSISLNNARNYGFSIAWQDTPNGQGMLQINRVTHDFTSAIDNKTHSLDIIYAHFNGVAQFKQQQYITTVSIGFGATIAKSGATRKTFPSFTSALGTRYEYNKHLALVTEARVYASLIDKNDQLFCQNSVCSAKFGNALWFESIVSVGIAYKF